MRGGGRRRPAWPRLVLHSYRLGARWLARGLRGGGWPHPRAGLYRLLVPLEPWRFWELGTVAAAPIAGDCLDLSSPKLLASLLDHQGRGRWVAVDLFADEVARWRALDPSLDLRVEDARALSFPDESFDLAACVSVIEHVPGDGDARAMAELWRVLRPGGVLHLTTNVAARPAELLVDGAVYGEASEPSGGRVFFERRYTPETLRHRLLARPWVVEERACVRERIPVHDRFFAARPWSFAAGGLLPLVCARNAVPATDLDALGPGEHAVVYLRLRKQPPV